MKINTEQNKKSLNHGSTKIEKNTILKNQVSSDKLLEVLTDTIFIANKKGQILKLIKSDDNNLFFSKEKMEGKQISEIVDKQTAKKIMSSIKKSIETKTKQVCEYDLDDSGSKLYFEAHIINQDNNLLYILIKDITELKKTRIQLNKRLNIEKTISEISQKLSETSLDNIDNAINFTLEKIGNLFKVDRTYIFKLSSDGNHMRYTHEWSNKGVDAQIKVVDRYKIEELRWLINKLEKNNYFYIPNVNKIPKHASTLRTELERQDITTLMTVPIKIGDKIKGFFGFDSINIVKKWDKDLVTFLTVIANTLSRVFERVEEEKQKYYIMYHDKLTKLPNRHLFDSKVKKFNDKKCLPLSIILIELNGLKIVNDAYGREVGDRMLVKAANVFKNSVDIDNSLVARWGGDEFVILLPKTDKAEADRITKNIHSNTKKVRINEIPLSISIGASTKVDSKIKLGDVIKVAEEEMYNHKLKVMKESKRKTTNSLLEALRNKHTETKDHTDRMIEYGLKIGEKYGLNSIEINKLFAAINLHDIGKINISDKILSKKKPLSDFEWNLIKKHPTTGYRIALNSEDFAHIAEEVFSHHERWDGTGYPRGLKGEEIPVLARMVSIIDAYEVMSQGRPYKKAMTRDEIIQEFKRCSGTQFDPNLVELFLNII